MEQQASLKAYQESSLPLGRQEYEDFFLSQPSFFKIGATVYGLSQTKVMKLDLTDTSTPFTRTDGEPKLIDTSHLNCLRNTNPFLKNLSDTELQSSIMKSVESSTRIEKPMFRFSGTCGSKKKSKRIR